MAGTLINETHKAINQGVSQQYEEGRFQSQVEAMKNCIPTLVRGVLRRNPLSAVAKLNGPLLTQNIKDSFVYSYDRGTGSEQYIIIIPGDGTLHTFNADGTYLYAERNLSYLTLPVGAIARESFEALTVGDHTFIVNKTATIRFNEGIKAPSKGYEEYAFYWIKKTTGVVTNQYQDSDGESGSRLEGYTYSINGFKFKGVEESRPNQVNVNKNTAYAIADEVAINPLASGLDMSSDAFAFNLSYNEGSSTINWSDTFGSEASLGVWKKVSDSGDLPSHLPEALEGFIVNITGDTDGVYDDYYLQYSTEEKTWLEVPAPKVYTTLLDSSMPHVLYRLTTGFKFDTYQVVNAEGSGLTGESGWSNRHTRGQDTLDDPSFIGKTLTSLFFHKNRLGFITGDSIILSSTNDYGNFFVQTAKEILDDDPIDLAIASTDVTILRRAVSTAGQLLLFADDTQFSLISTGGALTPKTADIVHVSNYTYDEFPKAKAIGNRVYFTSSVGSTANIYNYLLIDDTELNSEANNMTLHLPNYFSSSITNMVGHDVLGFIFFTEKSKPNELKVLNTITKDRKELQNAFHSWEFAKNIVSVHIINTDLYILFEDRDLVKMSLEIPRDIGSVQYLDKYPSYSEGLAYTSLIQFSKFFIRDRQEFGTPRGRYQLRTIEYTINPDSKYRTIVYSQNNPVIVDPMVFGPTWVDANSWVDSIYWHDELSLSGRVYKNDSKVTIMGSSDTTTIQFTSGLGEDVGKGFEVITLNVEGYFWQRSTRK